MKASFECKVQSMPRAWRRGASAPLALPGDGSLIQTLWPGTLGPGSPETFLTTHGSNPQPHEAASLPTAESQNLTISKLDATQRAAAHPDSHLEQKSRLSLHTEEMDLLRMTLGLAFPFCKSGIRLSNLQD